MRSRFSGKVTEQEIPVTEEQIKAWQDGALIQNAMPNLSPAQREFIKSGITSQEWDDMFGGEEDM